MVIYLYITHLPILISAYGIVYLHSYMCRVSYQLTNILKFHPLKSLIECKVVSIKQVGMFPLHQHNFGIVAIIAVYKINYILSMYIILLLTVGELVIVKVIVEQLISKRHTVTYVVRM